MRASSAFYIAFATGMSRTWSAPHLYNIHVTSARDAHNICVTFASHPRNIRTSAQLNIEPGRACCSSADWLPSAILHNSIQFIILCGIFTDYYSKLQSKLQIRVYSLHKDITTIDDQKDREMKLYWGSTVFVISFSSDKYHITRRRLEVL
jgi:hypothetical protein